MTPYCFAISKHPQTRKAFFGLNRSLQPLGGVVTRSWGLESEKRELGPATKLPDLPHCSGDAIAPTSWVSVGRRR